MVGFIGVVENRNDPDQLGRVQVRCLGWHTEDKGQIATDHLPWAIVMNSTNSASVSGVGQSPLGLVEGSWVFGIFMDGKYAQEPMVMGSLPGAPSQYADPSKGFSDPNSNFPRYVNESDVNALARGTNTRPHNSDAAIGEPADSYNAEYPFNHVYESESGHVREFDDTPGAERIREVHKSGTRYMIHPTGDRVVHVVGDSYHITAGKDNVHIGGSVNIIVNGSANITSGGSVKVSAESFVGVKAPAIYLDTPKTYYSGLMVKGKFPFDTWGSAVPILRDSAVNFPSNIGSVGVPQGYPPNNEQIDGGRTVLTPKPCGEIPSRNPYDSASEALSLGEQFWQENGSNPNITALWDEIGYPGAKFADKTAWCAVFVGAVLKRSGNKYIQSASSQAYVNYGTEVDLKDIRQGDIVVFYRGGVNSNKGHVGFYAGNKTSTHIDVLGGNQSDGLNITSFSINKGSWGLKTIRRAIQCSDEAEPPESTISPTEASVFLEA